MALDNLLCFFGGVKSQGTCKDGEQGIVWKRFEEKVTFSSKILDVGCHFLLNKENNKITNMISEMRSF